MDDLSLSNLIMKPDRLVVQKRKSRTELAGRRLIECKQHVSKGEYTVSIEVIQHVSLDPQARDDDNES